FLSRSANPALRVATGGGARPPPFAPGRVLSHMSSFSLQRVPARVLAIAATFSVEFGNAVVGGMFGSVGPLGAATARLSFAALILLALVRPRVRGWSRRTWLTVTALGLALAGMNTCIYLAFDEIPLGIAVTIELLGPLAVAAFGS